MIREVVTPSNFSSYLSIQKTDFYKLLYLSARLFSKISGCTMYAIIREKFCLPHTISVMQSDAPFIIN
jgi:hypothetical protein